MRRLRAAGRKGYGIGELGTYSNTSLRCVVFEPPHRGIVNANVDMKQLEWQS